MIMGRDVKYSKLAPSHLLANQVNIRFDVLSTLVLNVIANEIDGTYAVIIPNRHMCWGMV